MPSSLTQETITALVSGVHGTPFDVLGLHPLPADTGGGWVVRAFLPEARSAEARPEGSGARVQMQRLHPAGLFEATFPDRAQPFDYRLAIQPTQGPAHEIDDPYRFQPVLSDYDLHLFNEGTHRRLYNKLGAHPITHQGVTGTAFAVWAPNAERVSVVGDFNGWDGRRHPMRTRGASGVWELFIPGLEVGSLYKYEIRSRLGGHLGLKSDPFAFQAEVRPRTASIVCSLDGYAWGDGEWMQARRQRNGLDAPISIYEVHLGSWQRVPEQGQRPLTYRELADRLVPYACEMGFTHLELLPVAEHPLDASWGYQTTGYFAPTSRYGSPHEFMAFVDAAHRAGLGVIVDWVPAHFPKDAHGLAVFDGSHLYEHADPRRGEHPDWGTLIFNVDRTEVREFLLASALFWLDRYHVDGLRVDAVASMLYLDYSRREGEWLPNEYGGRENLGAISLLKWVNETVHAEHPDVLTFAEESTAWPMVTRPASMGGLGFDLKWNMGWMHDVLGYMSREPIHRRHHQQALTFSLLYAFNENFLLPLSHDEVVHAKRALLAKMPGDAWQRFANLRTLLGYQFAHPGKKLLFMGGEFGQWNEWDVDRSLDWHLLEYDSHRQLQAFVRDLNALVRREAALHQVDHHWDGFQWIDFHDAAHSVIAFLRRARDPDDWLLVAANFTPVPRTGYRLGVPRPGRYVELLSSDSAIYGGSNRGNGEGLEAEAAPWHGQPYSVVATLPPLAIVFLKPAEGHQATDPPNRP